MAHRTRRSLDLPTRPRVERINLQWEIGRESQREARRRAIHPDDRFGLDVSDAILANVRADGWQS